MRPDRGRGRGPLIRIRIAAPESVAGHKPVRGTEMVIGRATDCTLPLPDVRGLSREHLRIRLVQGRFRLQDLGSRNGTHRGGERVVDEEVLEGDDVSAGALRFVVEALRADSEPTAKLERAGATSHERAAEGSRRSRSIRPDAFRGFRLVRKLGAGGMGIVFEAEELSRDRRVALKVLRPHLARNAAYLARFIEEIRVLTSLRHPAIVEVFGRGSSEDLHFLTMELVRGVSARQAMREAGGRLPPNRAIRIVYEAAMALNAAHQQAGVLHGDVKPGNFLLDENGRVKLCDFGLAVVDFRGRSRGRPGAEDERRGTAAYAAPERFREGGRPSISGDIYSLGISLHQMLSGQLPFRGHSVAEFRDQHRDASPPPLPPDLGASRAALQLLVARMLAKDPDRRFRDYPALLQDLGFLLGGP